MYFMAHNSTIMSRCTAGEQRTHTDGSESDDGIEPVDIELNGGELAAARSEDKGGSSCVSGGAGEGNGCDSSGRTSGARARAESSVCHSISVARPAVSL